jgi:TolB-like protein/Tfp pilus assembly protein PilF
MNLISELNRRNVTRVALLYLIAAWLLIQVAETVLPLFDVPNGVLRGLVLLLVLGFVPTLVFAWVFELTPDGVKLERDVSISPQARRAASNKLDIATLIVASLTISLMIFDRLTPEPRIEAPEHADTSPWAEDATSEEAVRVAVLPFLNMSPDPGDEFFADGISEEILNLLARVPGLQVIGRTSSFQFKDRQEDLTSIGEKLGATHLLEGSVRRSADRVRITAQLVGSADGVRLWGQSWDREIDDVFAVQDEIGREVTTALQAQLAADLPLPEPLATTVPQAYAPFLQARALLARRGADNMHQAVSLLRKAIDIDPEYAPAHAVLAQTFALLPHYDFGSAEDRARWIDQAVTAAETAIELDADVALAWSALGTARAHHQWLWAEAHAAFDRSLELAPSDAEILNLAGDFYRILRDPARAVALEGAAVRLDPLRAFNHSDLAHAYHVAGDCQQALEYARSGNALDALMPWAHLELVLCNIELGRMDQATEALSQAKAALSAATLDFLMLDFWLAHGQGREAEARRFLQNLSSEPDEQGHSPARIGYAWLLLGEPEKALEWLERAYRDRDWSLVISEPIDFDRIAADPVVREVLRHPELAVLGALRQRQAGK